MYDIDGFVVIIKFIGVMESLMEIILMRIIDRTTDDLG